MISLAFGGTVRSRFQFAANGNAYLIYIHSTTIAEALNIWIERSELYEWKGVDVVMPTWEGCHLQ